MLAPILYELDPEAKNPNNLISRESYSLNTSDNDYRIIALKSGPFYEKDLIVHHSASNIPLIKGIDYNTTCRYLDLDKVTRYSLFAGIQILNTNLSGEFIVQYRTVGGAFVLPSTASLDYIINKLNDPKGIKWEHIHDKLVQYAPDEHTYNWHDHQNTDITANAISTITAVVNDSADDSGTEYVKLNERLDALKAVVDSSHLDEHIANISNPHRLTPAQVDGLPATAPAVNALKVYSKSLVELVNWCIENGINQTVIDNYLNRYGKSPMLADIKLGKKTVICNTNHTATLDLDKNSVVFNVSNNSIVTANANLTGSGTLSIAASEDMLVLSSTDDKHDDNGLTFNGSPVLTSKTIRDQFEIVDQSDLLKITFLDTEETSFKGKGTTSLPLSIEINIPKATLHARGYTRVTNVVDDTEDSVISSTEANKLAAKLNTTVSNKHTINGHSLEHDVMLDKHDIGLSNIDNTSLANKPLSTAQINELTKYSPKIHTHTPEQLDKIPLAGNYQVGIASLTSALDNHATEGVVLTPKAVGVIDDKATQVVETSRELLPIKLNVDQFGGDFYLPVPAQGKYGAAGITATKWLGAGAKESNGKYVFLRPGQDMLEVGVYYFYFDINELGSITNVVSTATQYLPHYLGAGKIVTSVLASGDDHMIVSVNDGTFRLVRFNGTMDQKHHVAYVITPPAGKSFYERCNLFTINGAVHLIYPHYDNDNFGIEAFIHANTGFNPIPLSGQRLDGSQLNNVNYFKLNTKGTVNANADATCALAVRHDNGFWINAELRHAALNTIIATEGNKARILFSITSYAYNSFTSYWGQYTYSLNIDFSTRVVSKDFSNSAFPIRIYSDRYDIKESGGDAESGGFPGSNANNTCDAFFIGNRGFAINSYDNLTIPRIFTWSEDSRGRYANMNAKGRKMLGVTAVDFQGNYGSPVGSGLRGLHVMADRHIVGRSQDGARFIVTYNTSGYSNLSGLGPTSFRKRISEETYLRYKKIPSFYDGQTLVSRGFIIYGPESALYTEFNPKTLEVTNPVSITSEVYQSITNTLRQTKVVSDNSPNIQGIVLTMYRFANGKEWAVLSVMYKPNANNDNKHTEVYVFNCSYQMSGTAIVGVTGVSIHYHTSFNSNSTAINTSNSPYVGGSSAYKLSDRNNCAYILNCNAYLGYVGNGAVIAVTVLDDANSGKIYYNYEFANHSVHVIPELGIVTTKTDRTSEMVYGNALPNLTYGAWNGWSFTGVDKTVISTRTSESFMLYITTEVPLVLNMRRYTLEKASFNIVELFPNNYTNKTINVGVKISEDIAKAEYFLSLDAIPVTQTQLKVGTVRTDGSRISSIDIDRVYLLPNFRELDDHIRDNKAHGIKNLNSSYVGLGNLRNAKSVNSLSEVPNGADPRYYMMTVTGAMAALGGVRIYPRAAFRGMVMAKSKLPVPRGFRAEQCLFFVTPADHAGGLGDVPVSASFDPNTLEVSVKGTNDNDLITATANWWCIVNND